MAQQSRDQKRPFGTPYIHSVQSAAGINPAQAQRQLDARSTALKSKTLRALRALGCAALGALPLMAHGASSAQQEYDSVVRSKADPLHGEKLFETCAACHGPNGAGVSDGSVPAIAAQHFRVLAHALVDYRRDKRWDQRMEHFTDAHHLNDVQDIADVAAYVSRLPATRSLGRGSGKYLVNGAHVYSRECASRSSGRR